MCERSRRPPCRASSALACGMMQPACKSMTNLRLEALWGAAHPLPYAGGTILALALWASPMMAQVSDSLDLEHALSVPNTGMLAADLEFLADDLLEGRAPGSMGNAIAARYVRSRFQAAGLEPGAPNGTYFQSVRLVGVRPAPSLVVGVAQRTMALQYLEDFVAWPDGPESVVIADGEIVFVGYGIDAPAWRWNDYQGGPMTGKIVMVLVNDPGLQDSTIFNGREMTYYGHWAYKIEQAARSGAAGVILVHTSENSGYPWSAIRDSWSGELFQLEGRPIRTLRFGAWINESAARRIVSAAGIDYDLLMGRARRQDFRPIPIGSHAVVDIVSEVRPLESANVIGRLDATDQAGTGGEEPESVVFTAHYDHLGVGRPVGGDSIFNGAVDNASGVAAILATAAGLAQSEIPSQRSVYFVALTAHEGGLLGAETFIRTPPVPLVRTAAVINIDRGNVWGRTRDIVALGSEHSTLGETAAAAAAAEGLSLTPDATPETGDFFRSDHFPFAREGIPALRISAGRDFVGQPSDWGRGQAEQYISSRYLQPADEYNAQFSLEGLLQQVAVMIRIGWTLAKTEETPAWSEDSEYFDAGERLRPGR